MDVLPWVLAGIVVYTLVALLLKRQGVLPDSIGVQGPILTLHTKRGRQFLNWLSGPRRFWRAWANFGVGIALVVMLGSFFFLLVSAVSALQNPPPQTQVNQPQNFLAIPGVNPFLPLEVAPEIIAGLVVGLVVHEGGHGLLCRVEDIEIESMGLAFLALIPVGAFVEPNEESQKRASRGGRTRMFAAGVTNNFAVTIVVYALLFGPVAASIGVAPGAPVGGVIPGSTADAAGIEAGDRITGIDGTAVANASDLSRKLDRADGATITVEVDGEKRVTVERSLLVVGAVPDGPANLSRGAKIATVNGTPVNSTTEFYEALDGREVATVTTAGNDSKTVTFPVGTYVVVSEDGPLARGTNLSGGDRMVVTSVDGVGTTRMADFVEAFEDTKPNQTITLTGYVDGERRTYEVTLGSDDRDDNGYLGVGLARGVSGVVVDDFGIRAYPAEEYLTLLGGTPESGQGPPPEAAERTFLGKMVIALFLPFAGVLPVLAQDYNFPGFAGLNLDFYQPVGPLGFMGDGVFVLANVLFWVGWINVQLGFFNCIPAFPLDGGHILRTSSEAIISRLPLEPTRQKIRAITTTVGITMFLSFMIVVFAPQLLGG